LGACVSCAGGGGWPGIENLPCELQRNFQLMRELDQRTEDKKAEIDILAAEYISTVKTLSPDQRVERLQKIQNAYSKCKEYSDDKVQLAMQTYEMVDKHIRRLDADLARFEADLKDKMEGSDFESSGGRGLKKGRGQKEKRGSRGRGRRTSEEDTPKKKKHKGGGNSVLSLPAPSCSEPEGPVPTVPFLRESGTPPGLFLTQCCFSRWQCCSCPIARRRDRLVRPALKLGSDVQGAKEAPSRGTGGWCRWADGSS
uniref:Inhibitor of growth protein N-terminal histone-binding domain-containing protein n=1 Tax=Pan paniscus TaxID=9597 RepID=A0A2R8ZIA5_PANPA